MAKHCYRTLDEAIVGLWGLEPLDLIVTLVAWLIATVVLGIPLGLLAGAASAAGLVMLKSGKPRGYVVYLFYKLGIMRLAPDYLFPGGWLAIEHGYRQGPRVAELFRRAGFTSIFAYKDLQGHPRVTEGKLPR